MNKCKRPFSYSTCRTRSRSFAPPPPPLLPFSFRRIMRWWPTFSWSPLVAAELQLAMQGVTQKLLKLRKLLKESNNYDVGCLLWVDIDANYQWIWANFTALFATLHACWSWSGWQCREHQHRLEIEVAKEGRRQSLSRHNDNSDATAAATPTINWDSPTAFTH